VRWAVAAANHSLHGRGVAGEGWRGAAGVSPTDGDREPAQENDYYDQQANCNPANPLAHRAPAI
ncbi:MAG: hypothetical protein M3O07_02110, partial [Pseudomonadota bacterium]|nr:hypothetical protein [Pseudomonadota bacterium]